MCTHVCSKIQCLGWGREGCDYCKFTFLHSLPPLSLTADQAAPVWEITGAEFSKSTAHTAGGISIRFPRVTRIRDDKDWTNATDLERLKVSILLYHILRRLRGTEDFTHTGCFSGYICLICCSLNVKFCTF